MENQEKQKQKNRIEEARNIILNAPEQIEEEFQRTANSWLACFGSCAFQIETYLFGEKVRKELGEEKYNIIQERIEGLKQKLHNLEQQYSDKKDMPPDEVKQELLAALDILK